MHLLYFLSWAFCKLDNSQYLFVAVYCLRFPLLDSWCEYVCRYLTHWRMLKMMCLFLEALVILLKPTHSSSEGVTCPAYHHDLKYSCIRTCVSHRLWFYVYWKANPSLHVWHMDSLYVLQHVVSHVCVAFVDCTASEHLLWGENASRPLRLHRCLDGIGGRKTKGPPDTNSLRVEWSENPEVRRQTVDFHDGGDRPRSKQRVSR